MRPLTQNKLIIEKSGGLIFFAERTKELLLHTTNDSYKVNAHHTVSRIRELISLTRHSIRYGVLVSPLGELLEELQSSISQDPILQIMGFKAELVDIVENISSRLSKSDPQYIQMALRDLKSMELMLSEYGEAIKSRIYAIISDVKNKKELSKLSELFIIECQQVGYTREYIRHASKNGLALEISSEKWETPADILDKYFSFFEGSKNEYICVAKCRGFLAPEVAEAFQLKISDDFKETGLEVKKYVEFLENTCQQGRHEETEKYLSAKFRSLDPYHARETFYERLRIVGAVRQYIEHESHFFYAQVCVIKDLTSNKEIRTNEPINVMFRSLSGGKASREENNTTELRLNKGMFRLSPSSRRSVLSAITFHREALNTPAHENKLIDLWAAMEGFLPQTRGNGKRITTVISSLTPILSLKYAHKKFLYAYRLLSSTKIGLSEILLESGIPGSEFEQFCAAIVCSECEDTINKILSRLDNYPLLRYRLWLLNDQFKSAKRILEEVARHQKKIDWHLRRIYIARNTVMHSATAYSDLGVLVENLHTYLDSLIDSVLTMASHAQRETSIEAALNVIQINHRSHISFLKSEDKNIATLANYQKYLFGPSNRLVQ